MTPEEERLSWLECLISSYESEHSWEDDEDESATHEMLGECRAMLAQLRAAVKPEPVEEMVCRPDDAEIPF